MWENGLIRKINLIQTFMASQPEKQAVAIHILPNSPRSKCRQLIEYKMRNIFLETYTNYGGETIPRLLSKKIKLSMFF